MEQTYITIMTDKDGMTVSFHRWQYMRLETCVNALVKLYRGMRNCQFAKDELAMATKVITYKTSYEINANDVVSEIDIATFIKMLE